MGKADSPFTKGEEMNDVDRTDFMAAALPVTAIVDGEPVQLLRKMFSSGSVGWHGNSKCTVHGVRVQ